MVRGPITAAVEPVAGAHVQRIHPGPGRDYYRRKLDEGKSPKEAMRCLKRQLAKVVYRHLRAHDATLVNLPPSIAA